MCPEPGSSPGLAWVPHQPCCCNCALLRCSRTVPRSVRTLLLLWSPLTHSSSHPMEQPCSCFLTSGENVFPYIYKNFPTFQPHQLPLVLLLCTSKSLFSLSSFRQMQKASVLIQKEQTPLSASYPYWWPLPDLLQPVNSCTGKSQTGQCFRCSLKRAKKGEITISLHPG